MTNTRLRAPHSVAHQDSAGERFAEVASRKWRWVWLIFPGTGTRAHSEHRFPAPSSKASLSGTFSKASLSGTFLQTARCGYATEGALYLRAAVYRRGQHPPRGSGTNTTNNNYDCRSNLAAKHAHKQRCIPPRVKKEEEKKKSSVSIQTILVSSELA